MASFRMAVRVLGTPKSGMASIMCVERAATLDGRVALSNEIARCAQNCNAKRKGGKSPLSLRCKQIQIT
jgi:hypothetical protein